jgi:hypothetical protein
MSTNIPEFLDPRNGIPHIHRAEIFWGWCFQNRDDIPPFLHMRSSWSTIRRLATAKGQRHERESRRLHFRFECAGGVRSIEGDLHSIRREGYSINCDGTALSWGECYQSRRAVRCCWL